ncbi:MAG TPA: hypothetical protein VHT52_21760 [Stellaceae bacterium]|jgi:hypothetical protein|nr:hypothetical protein [Stellaceae bacterium]
MSKAKALDPLNLSGRIYQQFGRLLDMLEDPANEKDMSIAQMISALKALQGYDIIALRRYAPRDTDAAPGAQVRKFSKAFQANASAGGARRRGAGAVALATQLGDTDTDDAEAAE